MAKTKKENTKLSHLEPVWDKKQFIKNKLNKRPVEFFIRNYRLNLNIALVICLITLVIAFSMGFVIKKKQANNHYYITSTDGRVLEYHLTNEDIQKMRRTFQEINSQGN